jgi:hypothetical protein
VEVILGCNLVEHTAVSADLNTLGHGRKLEDAPVDPTLQTPRSIQPSDQTQGPAHGHPKPRKVVNERIDRQLLHRTA